MMIESEAYTTVNIPSYIRQGFMEKDDVYWNVYKYKNQYKVGFGHK